MLRRMPVTSTTPRSCASDSRAAGAALAVAASAVFLSSALSDSGVACGDAALPAEDLESLSYWQVRKKAEEAGLTVDGRTKADYLAALRGSYLTRDMRAG